MSKLTRRERRTLAAICDAFEPSMRAGPGEPASLFETSAGTLGVLPRVEQALDALDPLTLVRLRLLLRALERPAAMRVLAGVARPFSALELPLRERVLSSFATSPVPQLRGAFQALKRLVTFLFYSIPGPGGSNPTWEALGYAPVREREAEAPLLALTRITRPTTLDCDVCVVGSGAGGGVVAAEAAATGKSVVVLEAGSGHQAPDFSQYELEGMEQLYLDSGLVTTADFGLQILAGATLGGGTAVNWQTCLAPPDDVREEWAAISGCRYFVENEFSESVQAVMSRLHAGTAESTVNANNDALRRGCEALGYHWAAITRNAHHCDPAQCGSCVFGCRHGGKQSTTVTYLCDAQSQGDTRIVPDCRAGRVMMRAGRVVGVLAEATDPSTGRTHPVAVRARTVVLAAGSLRTPLILLRSGIDLPAIGRNLFLHPTSAVAGVYAEPVEAWNGPPQTIVSDQFAHLSGSYGFRLETAPAHPGLIALASPWFGARDHRSRMRNAGRMATIIVLTRDRQPGRVRLGRQGQAIIDYRPGRLENAHLQRGVAEAALIQVAAGAVEVQTLHSRRHQLSGGAVHSPAAQEQFYRKVQAARLDANWSPLFSAHQMGTCAMGTDRRRAVCGPDGQVFGVRGLYVADASAFPASTGVNPMITIMALAHHTARGMV